MRIPKYLRGALFALIWLAVWEFASQIIGSRLILVSPLQVLTRLAELAASGVFWLTIVQSFRRIAAGFFLALLAGVLLAALAGRFKLLRELLALPMLTVKSIPVASFIILVLIWVATNNLAIVISFLMVLPIIYTGVLEGIQQTDPQLLEMADVFRISKIYRLRYVYLSQVLPYFISGCTVALGLCWKAGIAAEIIGLPNGSVGEMLYLAKLYLNTADIFAWTVVIVLVSLVFEKIFLWAITALARPLERIRPGSKTSCSPDTQGIPSAPSGSVDSNARGSVGSLGSLDSPGSTAHCDAELQAPLVPEAKYAIECSSLSFAHGDRAVLRDFSCTIAQAQTTCFFAPSGSGKTTLLRLLAGLEAPDSGKIMYHTGQRFGMVFQEDRLCDKLDALTNILLACNNQKDSWLSAAGALTALAEIGLAGHEYKPVSELSGGMRRRVALLRALLASSDILLLDEPFKGLDDTTKTAVIAYVRQKTKDKTVVLVTHDLTEAEAFNADIITL